MEKYYTEIHREVQSVKKIFIFRKDDNTLSLIEVASITQRLTEIHREAQRSKEF